MSRPRGTSSRSIYRVHDALGPVRASVPVPVDVVVVVGEASVTVRVVDRLVGAPAAFRPDRLTVCRTGAVLAETV